jgi:hypothetical protein
MVVGKMKVVGDGVSSLNPALRHPSSPGALRILVLVSMRLAASGVTIEWQSLAGT